MVKQYYGNELYHHGVKGQKWGQRLYQYEDGSLTPLGKARRQAQLNRVERAKVQKKKAAERRQAKEEKRAKRLAKIEDRKALKEARAAEKRKQTKVVRVHDLSKYSDDELREKTARLTLESDYLRARATYASLNPRAISKGEKVANYLKGVALNMLNDYSKEVGKQLVQKMLGNNNNNNNNKNNNNNNNNNNKNNQPTINIYYDKPKDDKK